MRRGDDNLIVDKSLVWRRLLTRNLRWGTRSGKSLETHKTHALKLLTLRVPIWHLANATLQKPIRHLHRNIERRRQCTTSNLEQWTIFGFAIPHVPDAGCTDAQPSFRPHLVAYLFADMSKLIKCHRALFAVALKLSSGRLFELVTMRKPLVGNGKAEYGTTCFEFFGTRPHVEIRCFGQ